MKAKLFIKTNLLGNALLILSIAFVANYNLAIAQSSSNNNNYVAANFIGWGTTSGDLRFKTNNNTRMTLKNTTGNFGIGTTAPTSRFSIGASSQFQVNSTGNLVRINNVPYSFPASQGLNGAVLMNNGSGTLTWTLAVGPVGPAGVNGINGTNGTNGSNGTNGISIHWLGTFAAAPVSPSLNDAYYNSTDKISYIWNGSLWNIIAQDGANGSLNGWNLTGNAGTVDGIDFIGTTDNAPINFRVNNEIAGRIDLAGPVFLGYQAGNNNTNPYNMGVGYQALYTNTTGYQNTANGYSALYSNTTGNSNTASGMYALYSNTIGGNNTANGSGALFSNTEGGNNTASGIQALYSNTSGYTNTANGVAALYSNTTGFGNTAVGYYADVLSGALTNATAIGYNAKVGTSNSLVLGGTGTHAVKVGIGTTMPAATLSIGASSQFQVNSTGNLIRVNNVSYSFPSAQGTANTVLLNDGSGNLFWSLAVGPAGPAGATGAPGANGINGISINWLGTLAAPPASPSMNDAYYNSTDKISYIWNGSVWNIIAQDGTNGAVGPAGPAGANGIIGTNGISVNWLGSFAAAPVSPSLNNAYYHTTNKISYIWNGSAWNIIAQDGATGPAGANGSQNAWGLNGSTGTVDGTNFIGTTDNVPFNIKVNNQKSGRIDNVNANTFFGYQSGNSNTSSYGNTASGYQTLSSNTTGNYNTVSGYQSMQYNTTGQFNTANGIQALYSNTTGSYNIANGPQALYFNTTGGNNIAIGVATLFYNTTGNANIAIGNQPLGWNTTGSENTAIGNYALLLNTIGSKNTAIGEYALYSNVAGSKATAIGTSAMEISNNQPGAFDNLNVAVGFEALMGSGNAANNTGNYNTCVGFQTLRHNSTGNYNVANGIYTLYANTTGGFNTAIGGSALSTNTSGSLNTAIGLNALLYNTTGSDNTANGVGALSSNTSGGINTATGEHALILNTIGSGNTANGGSALSSNTTGNNNTALGYNADVISGALTNATVIGYNAIADASDKVRIGNSSVSSNGGQVSWSTYSDARIKDNVQENVPGLKFINQLHPVTYHYNVTKQNKLEGNADTIQWDSKYDIEKIQFTGFIAQEVDAAAQKINYDFSGVDSRGPLMSLRYAEFVVPLVKAVQEQQQMIEKLSAKIESLQNNSNTGINNTETGNTQRQTQSVVLNGMDNAYLGQNVPNPFIEETHIEYYIPEALFCNNGNCRIIFYDQLGRTIQETVIEKSGYGTINVSTKNLPTGVFTYKLFVNVDVIDTKKMVFTK